MQRRTYSQVLVELIPAAILAILTALGLELCWELQERIANPEDLNELYTFLYIIVTGIVVCCIWVAVIILRRTSIPARIRVARKQRSLARLTKQNYRSLVKIWARYVTEGNDALTWRIRTAIAKEYAEQEKDDLLGSGDLHRRGWTKERRELAKREGREPEGRPLIITSFVRYSKLVKAVVQAVHNSPERENATIFCLTTLNMPLKKWLNFDEKLNCIHPEWEKYLNFVRDEIKSKSDVVFARVMLVCDDNNASDLVNLRERSSLKGELKNWVWLTKPATPEPLSYVPGSLSLINPREDSAVIEALQRDFATNQTVSQRVNEILVRDRRSYLICASGAFASKPSPIAVGEFSKLGEEFIANFHTRKTNGGYHAYYAVVDPNEYLPNWAAGNNVPPYPLDIFFVGLLKTRQVDGVNQLNELKGSVTPLFCLGAEPQGSLYVSYLYLVDQCKNPKVNFPNIKLYVEKLVTESRPLIELCNEP